MKSYIHQFDHSLTDVIRRLPRSWDPFFISVTHLGDPITVCLIAVAFGVWAMTGRGVRMVLAAAAIPSTLIVGYGLKLLFERARPVLDLGYNLRLDSFSFPSGHSSGAMITYGLLAYLAWLSLPAPWNIPVAVVLVIIPIVVGVSRVYLGVHYPSDVLAGWLLGLVMLAVVIFIVRPLS